MFSILRGVASGILRNAKEKPLSVRVPHSTMRFPSFLLGVFLPSGDKTPRKNFVACLVLEPPTSKVSATYKSPSLAFCESTPKSAFLLMFLFIFLVNTRSLVGPNVTPPPTQRGERVDPWRARPVPFCFHGLRPPPLTSPLSLVCAYG